MEGKSAAALSVIAAASLWGSIGVFSRYLYGIGLTPVQVTEIRCAVTAVVLLVVLAVTDRSLLRIRPRDLWMFLGTGVCSIVFFNICYFTTIETMTMSAASVLLYTAPCMVMLMSVALFHEKLTRMKVLALIAAFAGCALASGILGGDNGITAAGLLIGLGSGFGYALYSIFGRIAADRYHPTTVTVYTFLIAAVCLLPFSSPMDIASAAADMQSILVMLGLGVMITLVPYVLYTWGLERMDPGKASVIAFAEPMVATALGILFFDEPLTLTAGLGILLMLVSVVALSRPEGP